ncbi:MAG: hypothetical protein M5U26_16765 [Planctomycetota bacterium]|nr:hypothetical protein [Planctomycetota bacterium]
MNAIMLAAAPEPHEPRKLKRPGDVLLEPREAAVRLLGDFRRIAAKLAPRDRALQDDLAQEMALAALQAPCAHRAAFFRGLGAWRARDHLRRLGDPPVGNLEDLLREEDAAADDDDLDRAMARALGLDD